MANTDEKEIQKTLEEMNKRVADFQASKSYSSSSFSSYFPSNLKLILAILAVVGALIVLLFFVIKPVGKPDSKTKASPQNAIKYQQEQI